MVGYGQVRHQAAVHVHAAAGGLGLQEGALGGYGDAVGDTADFQFHVDTAGLVGLKRDVLPRGRLEAGSRHFEAVGSGLKEEKAVDSRRHSSWRKQTSVVLALVSSTAAAGTAIPAGSVTVTVSLARKSCAPATAANRNEKAMSGGALQRDGA